MSGTKNVGQVAGLFIGTSAPSNTKIIWYDSTPNQRIHKVYDPVTGLWKALDPVIVSTTTYSELVNNAKKNGLSIGKFYQVTDKANMLAIAITTTKVQYADSLGNLLVDDLGTNIQYHVSSGNLLIDDISGVFNTSTSKLVFSFTESTPNYDSDYLMGKKRDGSRWVLAKFKISSFLSKLSGNSITWSSGFFFSFSNAIQGILNKAGGVVGYDEYKSKVSTMETDINNVSKENQNIVANANKSITDKTTDDAIFNKKITKVIDTTVAPGDVNRGDTLFTIVSKIQRWINKFKYATGIRISNSYKDATSKQYVSNNDSVESAFGKVQYNVKNISNVGTLSSSFNSNYNAGNEEYASAGDTLEVAFKKTVGKLRGLGKIGSQTLESWGKEGSIPNTQFDLLQAYLYLHRSGRFCKIHPDKIALTDNNDINNFLVDSRGMYHISDSVNNIRNGVYSSVLFENSFNTSNESCALQAVSSANSKKSYDAFFQRLKVGIINYGVYIMTAQTYNISNVGVICYQSTANGDIYLPNNPDNGRQVIIIQINSGNVNIHASGSDRIDTINESANVVTVNERGAMFCFLYIAGNKYASDPSNTTGLWEYAKWARTNN